MIRDSRSKHCGVIRSLTLAGITWGGNVSWLAKFILDVNLNAVSKVKHSG